MRVCAARAWLSHAPCLPCHQAHHSPQPNFEQPNATVAQLVSLLNVSAAATLRCLRIVFSRWNGDCSSDFKVWQTKITSPTYTDLKLLPFIQSSTTFKESQNTVNAFRDSLTWIAVGYCSQVRSLPCSREVTASHCLSETSCCSLRPTTLWIV